MKTFSKDFQTPAPLSRECRQAIDSVLTSGKLFRYQHECADYVTKAEMALADYVGVEYALGVNSGGCTLFLAMKNLLDKLGPGCSKCVLTNSYTLSPVPGAILHAGGKPVFVECSATTYTMCLQDLRKKQLETGAKILCFSYMRGRIPDMDALMSFVRETGIFLVEDCAHSLGAKWQGKMIGSFGDIGCFSTQTNKLVNSGEGGFLTSNDDDLMARCIVMSGSYGHYAKNRSRPKDLGVFEKIYPMTPNFSMRMTEIAGALIYHQLPGLEDRIVKYNQRWTILYEGLKNVLWVPHFLPKNWSKRPSSCSKGGVTGTQAATTQSLDETRIVGSSFQFNLYSPLEKAELSPTMYEKCRRFSDLLAKNGVTHAWFGRKEYVGFTSTYKHWKHSHDPEKDILEQTDELLDTFFDIPLYHTLDWSDDDFHNLVEVIRWTREELDQVNSKM